MKKLKSLIESKLENYKSENAVILEKMNKEFKITNGESQTYERNKGKIEVLTELLNELK